MLLYEIAGCEVDVTARLGGDEFATLLRSIFSVFAQQSWLDLEKTITSDYYMNRNKFIINKLNSLHYDKSLHAIKPFSILCTSQYCPAISDGEALYFDDNHLSVVGASKLIKAGISLDYSIPGKALAHIKKAAKIF